MAAILWDNDGVLVDTETLYFEASRSVLAEMGFELTRERFVDLSLVQGKSAFEVAAERGLAPEEVAEGVARRNELYLERLKLGVPQLPGVRETLEALRGRVTMGIVTSSRGDHFHAIHSGSGLLELMDFWLVREDYRLSKPNPEPYLAAVERHGLDAAACVVVEDTERGLRAAATAGLRCLVIPHGLSAGSDFSLAHAVLAGVRDVPRELERIGLL